MNANFISREKNDIRCRLKSVHTASFVKLPLKLVDYSKILKKSLVIFG